MPFSRSGPSDLRRALPLLLLAVLAGTTGGRAQDQDLRFEHLSIDQGLSQNTVYTILQDRAGFLWFGTGDGLNRYDGYGFEVLRRDPSNVNSLSHNQVRALLEDRNGMLWIGTRNGGLERYDRRSRTFTHYPHDPDDPQSLSDDLVWAIHQDSGGRLWVGTGSGLSWLETTDAGRFQHLSHDPVEPQSLGAGRVRVIHEDRDGMLWLGTDGGLNRLDPDSLAIARYRPGPGDGDRPGANRVIAIHEDHRGWLWLGTNAGLARFDPVTAEFTYYRHDPTRPNRLGRDAVLDFHENGDGTLWIATYGGGLLLFELAGETFTRYRHDKRKTHGLSDDKVMDILEDRSGVLWVATSGGGLNKLNPTAKAFGRYQQDPYDARSLSDNMVMSINEDPGGILWVGTWNGGLNRVDRATGAVKTYSSDPDDPRQLASHDVRAILRDRHDILWVGTEAGGLYRLDPATDSFVRYRPDPGDPRSLLDSDAWVLYEDRAGILWVGTYGGGLSRHHPEDDGFSHFVHDPADPASLSNDVVRAMLEDDEGYLWVGTGDGGLNRLDPDRSGHFDRFRHVPGDPSALSSDQILSIHQDRGGTLWLGTHGGGLNKLVAGPSGDPAGATFEHYTEEDGLPSNVVYGILEDDDGALWLSTNRGLARFDPLAETFRNYDVYDGLQSNEFNSGAYHRNPQGELFFGGINGVNVFRPAEIRDNPFVPPVVLTSFKKFNEEVALETDLATLSEVTLRHDENVLTFEFAALSFAAPAKNRYAYKLSGFREQWTHLGSKRDVTFTNLDPGVYSLHVKGSNDDRVWSENGLSLSIVIEPPFWRTEWFVTLALLGATGMLWGGYKMRTRRMRRHNLALQAEVDERKRAEGARVLLITELEAKNAELEARNAEMERFTYTVSHDLKSPLVTIKGFLGLLRKDAADGDTRTMERDIEQISGAADTMVRLLADLLELSRVGRLMNPPEVVSLFELASEARDLVAGRIGAREVAVEIAPEMPEAYGDRLRLLEVYQNLIDNAAKFMGDQTEPRIQIGARRNDGEVVCWVRDNGMGIDPEYQESIFGLFNQLDNKAEGTGVGLALVQRIVEVHGGRIRVDSPGRGQGATFWFSLPRTPETAPADAGSPG